MRLTIAYSFLPKQRSLNTSFVMDHFGVDFEQGEHVIARDLELDVQPGDLVFFTGPSGSGKSSLLRESVKALEREGAAIVWIDRLSLPDKPLVDALPAPVKEGLDLLSACGLGEAQLLLRTPAELSDGQRYRFRLALGIAMSVDGAKGRRSETATSTRPVSPSPSRPVANWLVADEFSAALDRTLANVLAFNVRRLATRTGLGFLLATTHEDIIEDLDPDVLVRCDLDGRICVERRRRDGETGSKGDGAKPADASVAPSPRHAVAPSPKRVVSFFASSGSARVPRPTGRTSLGGIIAATP
jgi:hypothetical protein